MHSSFSPASLLSLCFSIGLILPTVIGRSLPLDSPTSLASPLYRRTNDDPGHVQEQVTDLSRHLAGLPYEPPVPGDKQMKPRKTTPETIQSDLEKHIVWLNNQVIRNKAKNLQKLRILFIEYAGSGGDVGKSMTYPEALKSRSLRSTKTDVFNKILYYFHLKKLKQPLVEMKLAVDCNYLKYMTEQIRQDWAADIEKCMVPAGDEAANRKQFMKVVQEDLAEFKPHIVIQGNAMSSLYNKKDPDFWQQLHEQMNKLVADDLIVRVNVKADFKKKEEAEQKKVQYPLQRNDVVLVGQPADFFKGLPSETRQTRIGRPQVMGMTPLPADLKAWLDKSKQVMYLGLGGPQRSRELPKKSPTESLNKFLHEILRDPEYKDWNFVMFHNIIQPKGEEEKEPIEIVEGKERVYHVWFGINILSILRHKNVDIAMHHCGRGILDDTIIASKVPICVGTSDYSDDQFEFAAVVEDEKMGRGIRNKENGIYFVDTQDDKKYQGVEKAFAAGPNALVEMFKDVDDNINAMREVVKRYRDGAMADTSGDLSFEVVFQLKYYQALRNPGSLFKEKE